MYHFPNCEVYPIYHNCFWTFSFRSYLRVPANILGQKIIRGTKIFFVDFIRFMGIKMTVWTCWLQIWMKFCFTIITSWEIDKSVSKNGKNSIIAIFCTFLPISQPVVDIKQNFKQIWNQLIFVVNLIPINPTKSTKNIFS